MSKKNKNIEKYVAKRLSKLIDSMSEYSSACECRISVISGKYGFAVINTAKAPTDNHSIMDYLNKLMKSKTYHALNNDITYDFVNPIDMRELKARIYDGTDLKYVTSTKLSLSKKSEPDYAKMQGIDLDEAADRQMDNFIDTTNERKALVLHKPTAEDKQLFQLYEKNKELERRIEAINRDMEGSAKAYEKQKADLDAKETELKHAYDKAAEDYRTIQKLTKEVGDLKIQIGKQNETIFQLKHPTPIETTSIVPVPEKHNELSTIVKDMNTKIDKLAEKVDGVETKEDRPEESKLLSACGVTMCKKKLLEFPVHKDELPDDYMLTLLQHVEKPYNLRMIFKLQSDIYDKIDPDVYDALIGIKDPRITNVRNFSRTAYAAAIALSVPEGYVGSFIRRLIDDYKYGDFKPTDSKYVPDDFPNFLESLYPDIARIHRLLHSTDKRDLPYVYKKEVGISTEYYMIGARPYDNPSDIKQEDQYVAIPKSANPYDFLEFDKTRELVMVFDQLILKNRRHRPIQFSLDDVESSMNGEDHVRTLKDQINRYIAADEAGLIAIDCNNPDEILKNGLWFYPVVWGYTV